jgi:hypothetical protein
MGGYIRGRTMGGYIRDRTISYVWDTN